MKKTLIIKKDVNDNNIIVGNSDEISTESNSKETNENKEKSSRRKTIAEYRRERPPTADELRRRSESMRGKNVGKCTVKCALTGVSIGQVSVDHEFVKNRTWVSFNAGRIQTEEVKQKISKRMKEIPSNLPSDTFKDRRWWNDGHVNKRTLTKPEGDQWVLGRLKAWQKPIQKKWGTSIIEV